MIKSDKNDDWNPGFQRKKKKNRVSRGKPERPRRYYAGPILCLIFVTWTFSHNGFGGLKLFGKAVADDARSVYAWATSSSQSEKDRDRQLERIRLTLANTEALIEQIQRRRAEDEGRRALEEAKTGAGDVRWTVQSHYLAGDETHEFTSDTFTSATPYKITTRPLQTTATAHTIVTAPITSESGTGTLTLGQTYIPTITTFGNAYETGGTWRVYRCAGDACEPDKTHSRKKAKR